MQQVEPSVPLKKCIKKLNNKRLVCGGLLFIGLTVGIFWYQFAKLPGDNQTEIWSHLKWGYLFWLLLVMPVETIAAGLRIWMISHTLQPGVRFWTCLKAEWANLGLAMLTPSQTGGGFGQIYMLNRGGMNIGIALTVSLISFLGSMVILLFIGIFSQTIFKVEHLVVVSRLALLIFMLVFSILIIAICWPGSLHSVFSRIYRTIGLRGEENRAKEGMRSPQKTRVKHLLAHVHILSKKLINLCYQHQANMHRFFRLNCFGFIWVCILSLIFMLSRAIMAVLCLRFLGIEVDCLGKVILTQLSLIFLIYFAPTPEIIHNG